MRYSKEKDMIALRETLSAKKQRWTPRANLKDYSLKHKVTMSWDLNEDAARDQIFKLDVGGNIVYLDWEEVLKAGRFV
jgi:hypothetical protein